MEKETLKSLRAKAKELRSKVSAAPLSKATPDQLRSEIVMLERAVKAEEKALAKKVAREASVPSAEAKEKKKTIPTAVVPAKAVTAMKAPPKKIVSVDEREKELLKRERELAKKEKYMQMKMETEDTSDSEDY
jgi:hypothetical protein